MSFEVLSSQKNPLLNREEIVARVVSAKNPSKKEILDLAGKSDELSIVKKINSNFGRNIFTAEIEVYETKEHKAKVNRLSRKERRKLEEEKKKATEVKA